MELVQEHPIKDVWRVKYGVLVNILKYESLGWIGWQSKMPVKVVRGCKDLKELKEDYRFFIHGAAPTLLMELTPTMEHHR